MGAITATVATAVATVREQSAVAPVHSAAKPKCKYVCQQKHGHGGYVHDSVSPTYCCQSARTMKKVVLLFYWI